MGWEQGAVPVVYVLVLHLSSRGLHLDDGLLLRWSSWIRSVCLNLNTLLSCGAGECTRQGRPRMTHPCSFVMGAVVQQEADRGQSDQVENVSFSSLVGPACDMVRTQSSLEPIAAGSMWLQVNAWEWHWLVDPHALTRMKPGFP